MCYNKSQNENNDYTTTASLMSIEDINKIDIKDYSHKLLEDINKKITNLTNDDLDLDMRIYYDEIKENCKNIIKIFEKYTKENTLNENKEDVLKKELIKIKNLVE